MGTVNQEEQLVRMADALEVTASLLCVKVFMAQYDGSIGINTDISTKRGKNVPVNTGKHNSENCRRNFVPAA